MQERTLGSSNEKLNMRQNHFSETNVYHTLASITKKEASRTSKELPSSIQYLGEITSGVVSSVVFWCFLLQE